MDGAIKNLLCLGLVIGMALQCLFLNVSLI